MMLFRNSEVPNLTLSQVSAPSLARRVQAGRRNAKGGRSSALVARIRWPYFFAAALAPFWLPTAAGCGRGADAEAAAALASAIDLSSRQRALSAS